LLFPLGSLNGNNESKSKSIIDNLIFEVSYETHDYVSNCLDYIKSHEGFLATPKKCLGGKLSIGIGHVIQRGEDYSKITMQDAESLLKKDFEVALELAKKQGYKSHQAVAVAHFIYALGIGNWNKSSVKRNPYDKNNWLKWCKIKGKKSKYLLKMREVEFRLFAQGRF
jgi:GH24 family phage-related lysozyme (muramidase)